MAAGINFRFYIPWSRFGAQGLEWPFQPHDSPEVAPNYEHWDGEVTPSHGPHPVPCSSIGLRFPRFAQQSPKAEA